MSPSSVKVLQESLLQALASELARFGFAARAKNQDFVQKRADSTMAIHVAFVRHTHDVDATLDLGLSLKAVDEMMTRAGWLAKGTAMFGAELGNIIDGRPRRWTIQTPADASYVARDMTVQVEKFALGWFERMLDLTTVFDILRRNDPTGWLLMPVHSKRCAIVTAVAAVLQRSDTRRVALECASAIEKHEPMQVGRFREYVDRIAPLG